MGGDIMKQEVSCTSGTSTAVSNTIPFNFFGERGFLGYLWYLSIRSIIGGLGSWERNREPLATSDDQPADFRHDSLLEKHKSPRRKAHQESSQEISSRWRYCSPLSIKKWMGPYRYSGLGGPFSGSCWKFFALWILIFVGFKPKKQR